MPGGNDVNFMFEIPNRGKRSVALNLQTEEGRELLYKLVATADVFVTNYLPDLRQKLKIDVEDIRARNPKIIYVRGSGQGPRGPEINRGGFDGATFWASSGLQDSFTPGDVEWPINQLPAFGDNLGGLTIAGGISTALLKRERTGETSVVDISLLSMALWAGAPGVTSSKLYENVEIPTFDRDSPPNPLVGTFPTKDGRFINLILLQADRFWPDLAEHLGRPDLIEDPRFKDGIGRYTNRIECTQILRGIFREQHLRRVGFERPRDAQGCLGSGEDCSLSSTTIRRSLRTAISLQSPQLRARTSRCPPTRSRSTRPPFR